MRCWSSRCTSVLLAFLAGLPVHAAGQGTPTWRVDVSGQARWTFGAERSPAERPVALQRTFTLDSVTRSPASGLRRVFVSTGQGFLQESGWVATDGTGRYIDAVSTFTLPPTPPGQLSDAASVEYRLLGSERIHGVLDLPAARLWELVPSFHPPRRAPGARWTDTLALVAEVRGHRVAVRGVRTSWLVRDTVVDNRRLWLVRDSATVTLTEHALVREYTREEPSTLERTTAGSMRGTYLFDDSLGLFRWRRDTTDLRGTARLQASGDRSIEAPVTFARTRHWRLLDSFAWAALTRARRDSAEQARGGMMVEPPTPRARRLSRGDTVLRDSLLTALQASVPGPQQRALFADLAWARDDSGASLHRLLTARLIAQGDTAALVNDLGERRGTIARYSRDDLQTIVGLLERPERLLAHGVLADNLVSNVAHAFAVAPPLARDAATVPACVPSACEVLVAAGVRSREQRVRDLALIAATTTEPARFADSLRARAAVAPALFKEVRDLVDGVGTWWPAGARAPLPPPGSDWRTWLHWMQGRDPAYGVPPLAPPPGPLPSLPRFEEQHRTVLAFRQAWTGRDVAAETRVAFAAATEDSARLVLGTMALRLGAWRPGIDSLATLLRSSSPVTVALAREAVLSRIEQRSSRSTLADTATAREIVDALLSDVAAADDRLPWRSLEERLGLVTRRPPTPRSRPPTPYYLGEAGVDGTIRTRWRDRIPSISREAFDTLATTERAFVLSISPVTRLGPFVRVTVGTDQQLDRPAGSARARYASATTYVLMRWDDAWIVVSAAGWVT